MKHLLVAPGFAIQGVGRMLKDLEHEVGGHITLEHGAPYPNLILLRAALFGEFAQLAIVLIEVALVHDEDTSLVR